MLFCIEEAGEVGEVAFQVKHGGLFIEKTNAKLIARVSRIDGT
jgi:hypothetical protein